MEQVFIDYIKNFIDSPSAELAVRSQKKPEVKNVQRTEQQLAKLAERRKRWQLAFADGLIEIDEFR